MAFVEESARAPRVPRAERCRKWTTNHLLALAQTAGIGRARVDEVVFERVHRADPARSRDGGAGLGLEIVRIRLPAASPEPTG